MPLTTENAFTIRPLFQGEHAGSMLRRFKKALQKDGTLAAVQRAAYFVPKSERRRLKEHRARKRKAKNG